MSCQPATPHEDKEEQKGIKYHSHIRRVSRESSAIKKVFYSLSIDFVQ